MPSIPGTVELACSTQCLKNYTKNITSYALRKKNVKIEGL